MYTSFKQSGISDDAKKTIEPLNDQHRYRWVKLVENTSFKHSSRKVWYLLYRLGFDVSSKSNFPKVNPSRIANRIIEMSRVSLHKQFITYIKKKLIKLEKEAARRGMISAKFPLNEINLVIIKLKTGKSVGVDEIFPVFFIQFQLHIRAWLVSFFNNIVENGNISSILKKCLNNSSL